MDTRPATATNRGAKTRRYAIIGAGIHGLSTAYHLALKLKHQGQPVDGIWFGHTEALPPRVLLAFRLDGGPTPVPPELPPIMPIPKPPESIGTAKDIQAGAALFSTNCGHCHANVPRAPVPDLRRSALIADEGAFRSVVRGGVLQERGMPKWDDLLTDEQVHLIRAWLIELARQGYQAERSSGDTTAPVRDGLVSGHP